MGHRLSFYVHDPTIAKQQLWLCGVQKARAEKTPKKTPKSADHKIAPKMNLAYPARYMVQTLPGDLTDVQGDENNTADKCHSLSLQVHGLSIAKQQILVRWSTKHNSWQKKSETYDKSADL